VDTTGACGANQLRPSLRELQRGKAPKIKPPTVDLPGICGERREEKLAAEAAPVITLSPFDNYNSIRTPEGASWDDRGYMRWTLPVSSGSNRPSPPRN
jgi:hypothetical protein